MQWLRTIFGFSDLCLQETTEHLLWNNELLSNLGNLPPPPIKQGVSLDLEHICRYIVYQILAVQMDPWTM